MITIQNRTLGQLQMLQVQSAGPPALADGQAGCGMCCVIVGRGGELTFGPAALHSQQSEIAAVRVRRSENWAFTG